MVVFNQVGGDIAVEVVFNNLQDKCKVVESGDHEVQALLLLARADLLVVNVHLNRQLAFPQLSSQFVVDCVLLNAVLALTKHRMLLGVDLIFLFVGHIYFNYISQ